MRLFPALLALLTARVACWPKFLASKLRPSRTYASAVGAMGSGAPVAASRAASGAGAPRVPSWSLTPASGAARQPALRTVTASNAVAARNGPPLEAPRGQVDRSARTGNRAIGFPLGFVSRQGGAPRLRPATSPS